MRSFYLVQQIISVTRLQPVGDKGVQSGVTLRQRWHLLLTQNRIARHKKHYFRSDATPNPVAPGDLGWQTGKWHQRVHEVGVTFAPQPCMHATHRGAHDETQMAYAETFG